MASLSSSSHAYCPAALKLLQTPAAARLTVFTLAVLRECSAIPSGRIATYGALAAAVGRPGAAQAVGNALHANPFAPTVPCHRVVPGSLRVGGFEGQRETCGGASGDKKRALLEGEGVRFVNGRASADKLYEWAVPAAVAAAAAAPARKRKRGEL